MTWQVEHTISYVDDGTFDDQQTNALKYFFDTWLPYKGWTVGFRDGEDQTSRYRIFQRNFTDLFTGQPDKHYLWIDIVGRIQYEDATYNLVPGDKGTDSTNSRSFAWHNAGEEYSNHSYKFWGSTENAKAFMVTRWDRVLSVDFGNDWPTYRPKESIETGPNIDRWDSCIWLPMKDSYCYFYSSNLPNYINSSNQEVTVSMGPQESNNSLGSSMSFWDTVELCQTSSSAKATLIRDDVKWFNGNASSTSIAYLSATFDNLLIVQVNGGDYWLLTRGSQTKSQIALLIGPTIPDFE